MKAKDLTGMKFNRLTVMCRVENSKTGQSRWKCKCDCGNESIVTGSRLTKGIIKSCGCLTREVTIERNYRHGLTKTRLYHTWRDMKDRCYNANKPKYKNYGFRGITVCDEWLHDFKAFYDWSIANGYNDILTIDRIDVDKGYSPDNCRWANDKTQANNKTTNHYVKYGDRVLTVSELAEEVGLTYNTLIRRILNNPDTDVSQLIGKPMSNAERMRTDEEHRKMCIERMKANKPNAIKVNMIDKDTQEVLKTFDKLMDAAKWIRENTNYEKADYSTINKVCKGKSKTAYGYKWAYADKGGGQ